ncbi:MAG TPA: GNAT family protein [Mycobacteriales bacterium]|nr:GNAT family protein [Mycobacteriales bacterium]
MSATPGWPATLREGPIALRPLRLRDGAAWIETRLRNEDWLAPWEGAAEHQLSMSWPERHTMASYTTLLRLLRRDARGGRALPFALTHSGRLAGQVTVSTVVRGAFSSASVGYWIDGALAGRGLMPTALALVADHCLGPVGLHRVEANIRPENVASRRVVEKLGFREEGLHRRLLFIDGDWRDHVCYALLREDIPEGVVRRWQATGGETA